MSPQQFIARFRHLHELARKGELRPGDAYEYEEARTELARLIVTTQELNVQAGHERAAFRIAYMVKVDVEYAGLKQSASTLDVGEGGFAALLMPAPPLTTETAFRFSLGAGQSVSGRARVVAHQKQGGIVRASFTFSQLDPKDRETLAMIIFDHVLEKIAGPKRF